MAIEDSNTGLYLHVDFPKDPEFRFIRARVRKAFIASGQSVMKEARRQLARRAVSRAGEIPGFRTGKLSKSIGYYVPRASSRRLGFMAKVAPNQKNGKASRPIKGDFYPAFLYYGVRRGAKRRRKHHKGASGGQGWKIEPRKNFMEVALLNRRAWVEAVLFKALQDSLRPVKK
ncbi:hypothetical protein EKN56_19680 [Limnobaculum zhutongyuii]|uniref:HK97 gp10 family phage protein n=1 Tax=Limnobaculum zhutongyuii TaxID=2498113 RepID=A0A411WQY2_9GAMM|nr:hypothetical protein [Limnobaculum zhutongyuii]QBH98415.1 hypothetical protein EKN56_19680 [Limnobaculum zhutongyuii]TQS89687.1 hypothetical protein ELQ32_04560 [Limnobaculum zhutongyuii]